MCPQEFCWGLSTTPLQMGQTNSSFRFNTNFRECWMDVNSDSQELCGLLHSSTSLDSSGLLTDASDSRLDFSGALGGVSAVAMSLQETRGT